MEQRNRFPALSFTQTNGASLMICPPLMKFLS
jgi:hypothetical protein